MALQVHKNGQPAQVIIDQALLKQIERSIESGVDVAGPVAKHVLKRGVELSIDGSALSAKARLGMPYVNPSIDCSAAEAKAAIRPRIEASVDRSLPVVKEVANASIQCSVHVVNSWS